MIGGRDHTTHHLYYLGLSERKIAFLFMGISMIALLMVTYVAVIQPVWDYLHIVVFTLFFLTVFLSLFYVTLRSSKSNEGDENKNE
jgi:UDP-GlcNAc:undecaprenyl-phosphate GlcNAc-1-phosphate transferase